MQSATSSKINNRGLRRRSRSEGWPNGKGGVVISKRSVSRLAGKNQSLYKQKIYVQ
jgi:hypothetical protein